MLAEQRRLEAKRQEQERPRSRTSTGSNEARHLKEKIAQFSQTTIGQKVIQSSYEIITHYHVITSSISSLSLFFKVIKKMEDEDISKLDQDLIMARQLEEMVKERKEL